MAAFAGTPTTTTTLLVLLLLALLALLALLVTVPLPAASATVTDGDGGGDGGGVGDGDKPLAGSATDLKTGGSHNEWAGHEGETMDPGIQFFRPGAPSHKIWPFNGRMPCTCQDLNCGCCADMVISSFNFNRTGCMNLTYDPYEFAVIARMFFGETMLFERSFSGKNPPPACVPVPVPYVPNIDFCVQFFDIYTPGRNLHLCMDWLARLQRAPVVVLHFDCMRVGSDGVALLKPEDGDGLPPTTPSTPAPPSPPPPPAAPPDDIYDEVAPGRNDTLRDADHLDPEDEPSTGQLDGNVMASEPGAKNSTVLNATVSNTEQSKLQTESIDADANKLLGSDPSIQKGHLNHSKIEVNATNFDSS